jgi:hypothetical protein
MNGISHPTNVFIDQDRGNDEQQFPLWQKNFPKVANFWKVELRFKAFYFKNAKNTEGVLLKLILSFAKSKFVEC